MIADERLGICLDTPLLFTAALEGAGLYPIILMFHGHAAVDVWLTKRRCATFTPEAWSHDQCRLSRV